MTNRPNSFDRDQLLQCGYGQMFGAGNAQLPVDNMLMMDRICYISSEGGDYGKGEIIAELDITDSAWFFSCHFPGDPVMPGCLGLDAIWQLGGFFLAWLGNKGHGRALGVDSVKFKGQILPQNSLVKYHLHIKRVIVSRLVMCVGNGVVSVDGENVYFIEGFRSGLFESP